MIDFDEVRRRRRWGARRTMRLNCSSCHKPFEATRPDAKTCSDKCRQQKRRDGKRAARELAAKKRKK